MVKRRALCDVPAVVGTPSFCGVSQVTDWFRVKVKSVAAAGEDSIQ
jgi:hypothetical protein